MAKEYNQTLLDEIAAPWQSFISWANPDDPNVKVTEAEVAQRAKIAQLMAMGRAQKKHPTTFGEGLAALGEGIGHRLSMADIQRLMQRFAKQDDSDSTRPGAGGKPGAPATGTPKKTGGKTEEKPPETVPVVNRPPVPVATPDSWSGGTGAPPGAPAAGPPPPTRGQLFDSTPLGSQAPPPQPAPAPSAPQVQAWLNNKVDALGPYEAYDDEGGDTTEVSAQSRRPPGSIKNYSKDPVATDIPPEGRAFLNAISGGESGGNYNIRYGGKQGSKYFDDYTKHPRVYEIRPDGRPSSAAGRGQIVYNTWKDTDTFKKGEGDFSPYAQDHANWELAQKRYKRETGGDLLSDLKKNGLTPGMVHALRDEWEAFSKGNPQRHINNYTSSMHRYANGQDDVNPELAAVPSKLRERNTGSAVPTGQPVRTAAGSPTVPVTNASTGAPAAVRTDFASAVPPRPGHYTPMRVTPQDVPTDGRGIPGDTAAGSLGTVAPPGTRVTPGFVPQSKPLFPNAQPTRVAPAVPPARDMGTIDEAGMGPPMTPTLHETLVKKFGPPPNILPDRAGGDERIVGPAREALNRPGGDEQVRGPLLTPTIAALRKMVSPTSGLGQLLGPDPNPTPVPAGTIDEAAMGPLPQSPPTPTEPSMWTQDGQPIVPPGVARGAVPVEAPGKQHAKPGVLWNNTFGLIPGLSAQDIQKWVDSRGTQPVPAGTIDEAAMGQPMQQPLRTGQMMPPAMAAANAQPVVPPAVPPAVPAGTIDEAAMGSPMAPPPLRTGAMMPPAMAAANAQPVAPRPMVLPPSNGMGGGLPGAMRGAFSTGLAGENLTLPVAPLTQAVSPPSSVLPDPSTLKTEVRDMLKDFKQVSPSESVEKDSTKTDEEELMRALQSYVEGA